MPRRLKYCWKMENQVNITHTHTVPPLRPHQLQLGAALRGNEKLRNANTHHAVMLCEWKLQKRCAHLSAWVLLFYCIFFPYRTHIFRASVRAAVRSTVFSNVYISMVWSDVLNIHEIHSFLTPPPSIYARPGHGPAHRNLYFAFFFLLSVDFRAPSTLGKLVC